MSSCDNCSMDCITSARGVPVDMGAGASLDSKPDYVVALAGNPNTGKSTVFNHLTGLKQHTGNWPGKTVARAEGTFEHAGKRFRLVDLPGTYSLLARSIDEEIARDFVLFGQPDCTVVVCDATVLERNLHLVLQIIEITPRVVVCVNLIDEARRKRMELDADILERELGVPVVPTVARIGRGLDVLVARVHSLVTGEHTTSRRRVILDPELGEAVTQLAQQVQTQLPNLACPRWIAMRLLDGDEHIEEALRSGELATLSTSPTGSGSSLDPAV